MFLLTIHIFLDSSWFMLVHLYHYHFYQLIHYLILFVELQKFFLILIFQHLQFCFNHLTFQLKVRILLLLYSSLIGNYQNFYLLHLIFYKIFSNINYHNNNDSHLLYKRHLFLYNFYKFFLWDKNYFLPIFVFLH